MAIEKMLIIFKKFAFLKVIVEMQEFVFVRHSKILRDFLDVTVS